MTPRTDFCHYCPAGPMTPLGMVRHEAIKHGVYVGDVKLPESHNPDRIQFPLRLDPEDFDLLTETANRLGIPKAEVAREALRVYCQPVNVVT